MENSQLSWNGQERENRECQRRGIVTTPHPTIDAVWVCGGASSPTGVLSIVSCGKSQFYNMNRRQIFGLMAQCAEALKKMEPGS